MKTPSREWKYLLHKDVAVHAPPGEGVRIVVDPPYGVFMSFSEIKLKKMYVSVPIPHSPGEIAVESCGCSFLNGKRLGACEDHAQL